MAREEDRISIVRGAKSSRGGATSRDQEMLEQEAGGDVGGSERAGCSFAEF